MAGEVLVDSNVYIDLLRAGRDPVATLYAWASEGDRSFAICGMVRLEVLRGIKSLKARQRVATLMDVMINVPSDSRLWQTTTDLAWNMDRKGLMIPGPDLVIAASAMRLGATVMTSDAHFSQVEGLVVSAPPAEWFT